MINNNTFEVNITKLVYGGEGMGRLPDGRAVFVPFVLPGETAQVRLVEDKRSYARGEVVKILTPAPERIQPRCQHFAVCGGCHYQFMDYAEQLKVKKTIVSDQLERIAGIPNPPVRDVVPSPSPWNYRNTVQFHLTPEGKLGYQMAGGGRVVGIRECFLPEEPLNELWPLLDAEPVPGLERISLRLGADGEPLVMLEGSGVEAPEMTVEDLAASVVHLSPAGALVLAGDGFSILQVLERPFRVSAGSFFQVNTVQAEAMVRHLLAALPLGPDKTVFDVYCGVGLFSAFLAAQSGQVVGIEASPSACEDFIANLDEFENVQLYEGEAGEILPALDVHCDIAVVDPPRAGLEKPALDALLKSHPPVLAYISCDPATLARDAKRLLAGGYQLEQVTPFDLFPQTYHIESISIFRSSP